MSELEIIPPKVIDILPVTTFVPPASGASDKPPADAPPLEEGTTRPEVTEAKELADADKAKVAEDAGKEPPKEPAKKEDDTPAWLKARISKEENRRKVAEKQAADLAEQLRQTLELARQYIPQKTEKPEPKREQYDDPDRYMEDRADWLAEQKVTARLSEERQKAQQAEQQKVQQAYISRLSEAEQKFPGISEVARDPTLPISEAMGGAIVLSDAGPEILHYLDENREDAQRISQLPPARAAAEIGKIEARLMAPKETHVSRAPKPINPINGGGGMPKSKYDPGVTDDEYFAMVEKENAERLAAMQRR